MTVSPVTTETSPKSKSYTGVIVGGAIGGVGALLAIGAIALVARRRRRPSHRPKSVNEPDMRLPTTVTPFNTTLTGAPGLEAGPQWWGEPDEPGIVPLVHASTPLDSPARSPPVAPIPIGLSSKELARLREDNMQPTVACDSPSGPLLTATAGPGVAAPSSDARRLQSEVESLRREMEQQLQQLRAERYEAPPDYEDGAAS